MLLIINATKNAVPRITIDKNLKGNCTNSGKGNSFHKNDDIGKEKKRPTETITKKNTVCFSVFLKAYPTPKTAIIRVKNPTIPKFFVVKKYCV